jgi:hypothetical protein
MEIRIGLLAILLDPHLPIRIHRNDEGDGPGAMAGWLSPVTCPL